MAPNSLPPSLGMLGQGKGRSYARRAEIDGDGHNHQSFHARESDDDT